MGFEKNEPAKNTSNENLQSGGFEAPPGMEPEILERPDRKPLGDRNILASEIGSEMEWETTAERDPEYTLSNFDKYKNKKFGSTVLKIAVKTATKKQPEVALKYYDLYRNKTYAKTIAKEAITNLAKTNPKALVEDERRYHFCASINPDAILEAIKNLNKVDPRTSVEMILKIINKYDNPYYIVNTDMIIEALEYAVDKDPELVLENERNLSMDDKYSSREMLKRALMNLRNIDPKAAEKYGDRGFEAPPGMEPELINPSDIDNRTIFHNYEEPTDINNILQSKTGTMMENQFILEQIAKNEPITILREAYDIGPNTEYTQEFKKSFKTAIRIAVDTLLKKKDSTDTLLTYINSYADDKELVSKVWTKILQNIKETSNPYYIEYILVKSIPIYTKTNESKKIITDALRKVWPIVINSYDSTNLENNILEHLKSPYEEEAAESLCDIDPRLALELIDRNKSFSEKVLLEVANREPLITLEVEELFRGKEYQSNRDLHEKIIKTAREALEKKHTKGNRGK